MSLALTAAASKSSLYCCGRVTGWKLLVAIGEEPWRDTSTRFTSSLALGETWIDGSRRLTVPETDVGAGAAACWALSEEELQPASASEAAESNGRMILRMEIPRWKTTKRARCAYRARERP